MELDRFPLARIADLIGTPFYLYDATVTCAPSSAELRALTDGASLRCRYALKANSARRILSEVQAAGLWADAVSGNEVLRAIRAGFPAGNDPPCIMLTSDVFRDNALTTVLEQGVLPNVGSPGMVRDLRDAGYRGPSPCAPTPASAMATSRRSTPAAPLPSTASGTRTWPRRGPWPPRPGCPSSPCTCTSAPAPSWASSTPTCAS